MKNENVLVIQIMGREFSINCPDEEREEFLKAVDFLNNKIHEIKAEGKIIDSERIIIAAALGITHELLAIQRSNGFDIEDIKRRITDIRKRVKTVLSKSK